MKPQEIKKFRRCKLCGRPIRNPKTNKSGYCTNCGNHLSREKRRKRLMAEAKKLKETESK